MEITTREDIGGDLLAPQAGGNDTTQWSYSLTSLVQPGDVVFHYATQGVDRGSIVGWSVATGPAYTIPDYTWQARGTAGRDRGAPTTGPGWRVPLGGLNRIDPIVGKARLQALLDDLMHLRKELEDVHGTPIYFPWFRYGGTQLRAQQGYLTKFPAELLTLLPGLRVVEAAAPEPDAMDEVTEDDKAPRRKAPRGRLTRVQDPVLRAAIERRSLDVALKYYEDIGGTDVIELGKPYDIRVTVEGKDRHAEVKGSSMIIDTVELTINEVTHAHGYSPTDLIVVDEIEWSRAEDGTVSTSGGRLRVWRDWAPRKDALEPRKFAYTLPSSEAGPDVD